MEKEFPKGKAFPMARDDFDSKEKEVRRKVNDVFSNITDGTFFDQLAKKELDIDMNDIKKSYWSILEKTLGDYCYKQIKQFYKYSKDMEDLNGDRQVFELKIKEDLKKRKENLDKYRLNECSKELENISGYEKRTMKKVEQNNKFWLLINWGIFILIGIIILAVIGYLPSKHDLLRNIEIY